MSQRRLTTSLEDGTTIALTWEQGPVRFTLEVEELPVANSSTETAIPATACPEPPVATTPSEPVV